MNSTRHNMRVCFVAVLLAMTSFFALVSPVFAQSTELEQVGGATGLGNVDVRIVIARVINAALGLLGVIAVALIVYSGFLWMMAAGNPDRTKKARAVMINAVIGLMIVLASYSITTYVLNRLLEATGYEGADEDEDEDDTTLLGDDTTNLFVVSGASPQGTQTIRNLTVRLTFNRAVDETTAEDAITVTASDATAPVTGTFSYSSSGRLVTFTPDTLCSGYTDVYCFEENTTYAIVIDESLESANGLTLTCGGLYDACEYEFTSGSLIDTEGPEVTMTYPDDGDSIEENTVTTLQATVTDDAGVSLVEFYVDGELIGEDQPSGSTPTSYTAEIDWDNTDMTTGLQYEINAVAYDVDSNDTQSDSIQVTIRAAHCFSGATDEDETGEDCGGADCAACGGESCTENAGCASGVCENGVCVDYPEITGISPTNGAVGTYVTISGTNFGSQVGSVSFGDTTASLAVCDDPWDTDQIIVVVPDTLTVGESYVMTVTTADGYADTNQDDNGSLVDNFEVNSTVRPGLCEISPDEDVVGEIVSFEGVNFEETQGATSYVYFGTTEVGSYADWSDAEVLATVPTVAVAEYDVTVEVDGVASNSISFEVIDEDAGELPTIGLLDPDTGPVGEYITISGSNFGSTVGEVYFVNADEDSASLDVETLADVVFPAACEDDYWQRDQIIVKVPSGLAADATDFEVYVERADDEVSSAVSFTLASGAASPGICSVEPDAGPAGYVGVTIAGEGFGDEDEEGTVTFYANDDDSATAATVTTWDDEEVILNVPSDAVSGPITLFDADGNDSNEYNFEVGDCNQDTDLCDANTQQCCESGACVLTGSVCPDSAESIVAHYAWVFSTGDIPEIPEVVFQCSNGVVSPTPWDGRGGSNGEEVCINAVISATFDLTMDQNTMGDSSILLGKCDDIDPTDPCASMTSVAFDRITTTSTGFTAVPLQILDTSSTYQVTLTSAIESYNGDPLETTTWTFGTSVLANYCDIGSVLVAPSTEEITSQYGTANFSAQAVAEDACVILDSDDYVWAWSTDGTYADLATATASCTGAPSSCQVIEGIQETPSGSPTDVTAEEGGTGLDDDADLTVNFTDPYVVDQWPDCSTACINAEVIAEFNTEMEESTILATGAVNVYACADEQCEIFTETVAGDVKLASDEITVTFTPDAYLSSDTYYRVVLAGTISSTSGVTLQDSAAITLNYNDDQDYSWTFRTRDDTAACEIDRIEMDPPSAIVDMVGERTVFEARAYGPPDECSVSGQALTATSYDWTWEVANTLIATLWSDGDVVVSGSEVPDGCTSTCVAAGTESYIGICGQDADGDGDLLDTGEDCDEGDTDDGDGCSSSCLNEGTEACASATSSACCGNSTLDTGEECDDGAVTSGDGCSSSCLNEGSLRAGVTCGNDDIAPDPTTNPLGGGEDCDDGNTVNSDGCSSICLNEGTSAYEDLAGICGNGTTESPAEECDDGNTSDDDGCSSSCLAEGLAACDDPTIDLICCGNLITEARSNGAGETCDDGNATDGDGCSSICLLEGSSTDYDTPSFCGDSEFGLGESSACEISSSDLDGLVEPLQITVVADTAPAEVDATTRTAETEVTAEAEGEDVSAEFILSCSCQEDSDCSDSTTGGCGSNGCCYDRPDVLSYAPTVSDACRNSAIYVEFDQEMDIGSFTTNASVTLTTTGTCPYTSTSASVPGFFGRLWQGLVRVFQFFIPPLSAQSATCEMPVTFQAEESTGGQRVYFIYNEVLEEDGQYTVTITGDASQTGAGVRSENGVGMSNDYTYTIDVGDDYCLLEEVAVTDTDEDSPNYFSATSEAHDYTAVAYTNVNGVDQELQSVPGIYEWSWGSWTVSDSTIFSISSSADTEGDNAVLTALGQNGTAEITATATITEDDLFSPSTVRDTSTGTTTSTVYVCENPWPVLTAFPFEDSADASSADPDSDGVSEIAELTAYMHFSTFYCRDADADGSSDDYEALDAVAVSDPPGEVLKEYLFEVSGDDVIGIRVVPNENLYSVSRWYEDQGFTGSPTETTVDGYQALTDGRTTYVSAANVSDSGDIYANVYAISYNANADQDTVSIYTQLVENWSFNTNVSNTGLCYDVDADGNDVLYETDAGETVACSSNLDCSETDNCHADKDKLTRDLTRLTDLREIEEALAEYGEENGRCSATTSTSCTSNDDCPDGESCEALYPELSSGTFLRAYDVSAWDSWDNHLSEALGDSLSVDPLNDFADCGDTSTRWGEYDAVTCWNATRSQFVCPTGSHVYLYRNVGGTAFQLRTDLEYAYDAGTVEWAYDLDQDTTDSRIIRVGSAFASSSVDGYQAASMCNNRVYGLSSECGDGVLGASESCEIGDTGETGCTAAVCVSADADYDGRSCEVDCETATSVCGGDADDDGLCDSGTAVHQACDTGEVDCTDATICQSVTTSLGTQATTCDNDCSAYGRATEAACVPLRCGNGVVEGTEECDDGSRNGDYGYCGSSCTYASGYYCGDDELAGGETCDLGDGNGVYAASAANSCSTTCDGPGPYCGDAEVNGTEECDGESEDWEGRLCDNGDPCESDDDCTDGSTCGDTYWACPVARICSGGTYDGYPCEVTEWPTSAQSSFSAFYLDVEAALFAYRCETTGGGTCDADSPEYQTYRTRSCDDTGSAATCAWNIWAECNAADQLCGNGEVEGDEECDDGDDDNNNSCTNLCMSNVCGDGYLYTGEETCDEGSANGDLCDAGFGETCRYCSTTCNYLTASGDYCGDGVLDETEEYCDASNFSTYHCYYNGIIGDTCETLGFLDECADSGTDYVCQRVGVCNGGPNGGEYCTIDANCGRNFDCVQPECAADCASTCPFTYETAAVSITSEEAGSSAQSSLSLYDLDSGESPNHAILTIPACRAVGSLVADLSAETREYPDVDIIFVFDKSLSMANTFSSGQSRLEVLQSVALNAVDELFDSYDGVDATMQIGFITYTGQHGADSDGDGAYEEDEWSVEFDHSMVSSEDETLRADLVSDMSTMLSSVGSDPGTPIYSALYRAIEMLSTSDADEKYIITFSDGSIRFHPDDWNLLGNLGVTGTDEYGPYLESVAELTSEAEGEGIEFFTVTLSGTGCNTRQMQNFSSMSCTENANFSCTGNTVLGNVSCTTPDNGLTYAFNGTSAEDLAEMYQDVVDSILNINVIITDEDGNTDQATVEVGDNVVLPLPAAIICDETSEQEVAIEISFGGEGSISFDNIELQMCEP